jgi:hypothetical protein
MKTCRLLILCALLICTTAYAQAESRQAPAAKTPEALLPADALFYFRYDGYDGHRTAYDKTALARVMKDDLGDFCAYVAAFCLKTCAADVWGRPAENSAQELDKLLTQMKGMTDCLWRHGVALSLEFPHGRGEERLPRLFFPFHGFAVDGVQLTAVFPESGNDKERKALFAFLRTAATLGGAEVKERKKGGRTIHESADSAFRVAWWQEGTHVVLYAGWEPVERALDVIDGRRPNIVSTALQRKIAAFDRYETDIRGYVDLEKVVGLWRAPKNKGDRLATLKEAMVRRVVLSQLGLTGLQSLTFHLGFDRRYQRSTVVLSFAEPGKRAGLLRLVSAPLAFTAENLPALPPDAALVSVRHVDWDTAHEVITGLFKLSELGSALRENRWPPREIANLSQALGGVDLKKELLSALGSTLVTYHALSEGPYLCGYGVAVKVKDPQQAAAGMRVLVKAFQAAAGVNEPMRFQKRIYRGVELYTLAAGRELPIPLTYTVHKGWLVIGAFPQAVKGYILRSEGRHKVWQAPPLTAVVLDQAKKAGKAGSKLCAVTVTDPRPTVEVVLAVLPAVVQILQAFDRRALFDVTRIPNAQAVTEPLLPNTTVLLDDGDALRWESEFSIALPGVGPAPAVLYLVGRWALFE